MNTRIGMTAGLAVFAMALVMIALVPSGSAQADFEDVSHSPSAAITSDDQVEVTVELDSTDNVSAVNIQVCIIEPNYNCYQWDDMDQDDETFTYTISAHDGGSLMGYKIEIEYDDGTDDEYSPSEDTYHEYEIEEDGSSGGGDDGDDTPFLGAPLIAAGVVVAAVAHKGRRR